MKFFEQHIKGVYEVQLKPIEDSRGFFMRTMDVELLKEIGHNRIWVQENHSLSFKKNVLRGLHFQLPPYSETKLIRVISGSVLDVFVDLREKSETFGEWGSIKLSSIKNNMAYIPRGFAHGYVTLEENTEVVYKVDNFYHPESEKGILWNDPQIGIYWKIDYPVLSEKDKKQNDLNYFIENTGSIKIN